MNQNFGQPNPALPSTPESSHDNTGASSLRSEFAEALGLSNLIGEVDLNPTPEAQKPLSNPTLPEVMVPNDREISQTHNQVAELTNQLVAVKSQIGEKEIATVTQNSTSNHTGEIGRLIKMIAAAFQKPEPISEHGLVERRNGQKKGIIGAMTGNQNKLAELNGASAAF